MQEERSDGLERWPECHAGGSSPEGFSEHDEACLNCPEKFSCLPLSVEKGLARSVEEDAEVVAVTRGKLVIADALVRQQARAKFLALRQDIPQELLPDALREAPANEQTGPVGAPPAPPTLTLVTSPHDCLPKAGARAKRNWDSAPKEISEQEMAAHLAPTRFKERGVRISQPFQLEVGMQLIRQKRDRSVVVTLRSNGFEYEGKIYPTLSAAAIASEHRSVSGNDFFNLEHPSSEIRAADGTILARGEKKGLPTPASEDTTAVST